MSKPLKNTLAHPFSLRAFKWYQNQMGKSCVWGDFKLLRNQPKKEKKLLSLILRYIDSPQITFPNPISTLLNFVNLLTTFVEKNSLDKNW